jgi:anthranilate synthase component 1
MVSTVRGRLRTDRDVFDLLRAVFPAGSMTGAPKIAAMGILAELEPVRRGVYAGAIGYLDLRGGASLAVVIRTVVVRDGRARIGVGGGIVADSDPAAEWQESWDKAAALLAALGAAEAERS